MHFELRKAGKMHKNESKSIKYWNLHPMNQWNQENCFGSFHLQMTMKSNLLKNRLEKPTWRDNYLGLALEGNFKNLEVNPYIIALAKMSANWRLIIVKSGYCYGLWQIHSRRSNVTTENIKLRLSKTRFWSKNCEISRLKRMYRKSGGKHAWIISLVRQQWNKRTNITKILNTISKPLNTSFKSLRVQREKMSFTWRQHVKIV